MLYRCNDRSEPFGTRENSRRENDKEMRYVCLVDLRKAHRMGRLSSGNLRDDMAEGLCYRYSLHTIWVTDDHVVVLLQQGTTISTVQIRRGRFLLCKNFFQP